MLDWLKRWMGMEGVPCAEPDPQDEFEAKKRAALASGYMVFDGLTLYWGAHRFVARGGRVNTQLPPEGMYGIRWNLATDGERLADPFRIGDTAFWLPLEPMFKTSRSGFGIHPDGAQNHCPGTIGIQPVSSGDPAAEARSFWDLVKSTGEKPPILVTVWQPCWLINACQV